VASALVYNANGNDVDTVLVGGQVLVRGGQLTTLDERGLIADCQRAAEKMCARAGIATENQPTPALGARSFHLPGAEAQPREAGHPAAGAGSAHSPAVGAEASAAGAGSPRPTHSEG
jgi:hypothetical protein